MNLDLIKTMIEGVGAGIECDADWTPTLIYEAKGNCTIAALMVNMMTQLDRNIAAALIKRILKEADATAAVWITTAWTVDTRGVNVAEMREYMTLARQHQLHTSSKKIEVVAAVIAHRNPADGPNTVLSGRIIRSVEHPKVDWDWLNIPDDAECELMGTFPEALIEGVKAA